MNVCEREFSIRWKIILYFSKSVKSSRGCLVVSFDLENCFSGSENGILAESSRICRYMQVALVVGFYRFPPGKGQGALGTSGVSFMTSF